jgi:catechol 2,3-dioxygenase
MSEVFSIDPAAHIGLVSLTVSDLERAEAFYRDLIGFRTVAREGPVARLAADGANALLELVEAPEARHFAKTTGLYHFAILVPSRGALADAVRRLLEKSWPPEGAADHGVSEAIYLADPDGNGIEIYRDRPRSEWTIQDGEILMDTRPLQSLMDEPSLGPWNGLDPATRIGHIHLHVRDLAEARRFYEGVLGFDVVARYGPGALFVSAGGYHHHIGLNTWNGVGAPPPPPGSVGLRHFTIDLPADEALASVQSRLKGASIPVEASPDGLRFADPSENGIVLRVETSAKNRQPK